MISIDYTLAIQVALFIILMVVLNKLLFQPFVGFLQERQEKIEGDEKEAARLQEEAEHHRAQCEGLNEGQRQALQEKARLQDTGTQEGKLVIDTAQKAVEKEMPQVKARIEEKSRRVFAELKRRQEDMAKDIAEKILGRNLK